MPKLFATGNSEISSREKRNMERARKVASQGMVLLENKGALPIDKSVKQLHCSVTVQEEPSKAELVREMSTAALW